MVRFRARRLWVWFSLMCLHVLPMGFLPNTHQRHAHRVEGTPSIAPECEPSSSLLHLYTRLFFTGLAVHDNSGCTWCPYTQTNAPLLFITLGQSRLHTGLSHDWSRVWNFSSNIHESRPALHHLCATLRAPGRRARSRERATALWQRREAEQRKKLRKW